MKENRILLLFSGVFLGFIVCCLCVLVIVVSYSFINITAVTRIYPAVVTIKIPVVSSPTLAKPTQSATPTPSKTAMKFTSTPSLTPSPTATLESRSQVNPKTLNALEDTLIPLSNLLDLAARLEGKPGIPLTLEDPIQPYQVGNRRGFWVANTDTKEHFKINARLEFVTDHAYFWIQDGVEFNLQELEELALAFETKIYSENRAFFGSEWAPGVDNDPRIFILYAQGLGGNLAGYFSSADEYHPLAHEYSNALELFLLNADNISLAEDFTYGVLAHEFQHMIHWHQDRNESSWLNEGFSELAAFLNGYYSSGFDWLFVQEPDLQLNDWPNDPDATTPHYGSGFLFLTYFLDRFGEEATQALVAHPENDLASVDSVLTDLEVIDPLSGLGVQADDVFIDWTVSNYLQDGQVSDGRYDYKSYQDPPRVSDTESYPTCPVSPQKRSVSQYGADYIRFTCQGNYMLRFTGRPQVAVLPVAAYSGSMMFWSNKGDESDMRLTRAFDFRDLSGPLSLQYSTWYDLEDGYDYLYLEASLDGITWEIVRTPSGTEFDPSGNSYGWGYNGLSGGGQEPEWITESVDISQYAGLQVQLRFEYITDAAVNGEGLVLDDIVVPEIGYLSDLELDDGGWQSEGWARIENSLPQTYRLALITIGSQTLVQLFTLSKNIAVDIPLQIGGSVEDAILVVTGTTRFTRQKARYTFEVLP